MQWAQERPARGTVDFVLGHGAQIKLLPICIKQLSRQSPCTQSGG